MARPLRLEYEGAIYHVMARGNEWGTIFRLNSDRLRFLEKLGESAETFQLPLERLFLKNMGDHISLPI